MGAAVIRAVATEHLGSASVKPGHTHRVFYGLGSTIGEKHVVKSIRCVTTDEPSCLTTHVVGVLGGNRAESISLVFDGRDHARVLVANVGVDELRREIEKAVAVVVIDVGALSSRNRHGRNQGLR